MSDELAKKLGYQFNDPGLLKIALTHRSCHEVNNERMEFLGDSIVNVVIAEALYHQYKEAQEGDLSRWRAHLINRDTLGDLGRQFELGRYLHLGPGEIKSGGDQRLSILSCAMEAVIGAVFIDGGFEIARQSILRWYAPLLASFLEEHHLKDPKTTLQETLQRKRIALPVYTVESIGGKAHQQKFIVSCVVDGIAEKGIGKGTSRRRAEQAAASAMLDILKQSS